MEKYTWTFKNKKAVVTQISVVSQHLLTANDLKAYKVLSPKSIAELGGVYWSHSVFDSVDEAKANLKSALEVSSSIDQRKGGVSLSEADIQAIVDSCEVSKLK